MSHKLNSGIAVIGIDIGKNSFHVVGHDKGGAIILRQKWSRVQVGNTARQPAAVLNRHGGLRRCHHLSRKLRMLGHDARLIFEGTEERLPRCRDGAAFGKACADKAAHLCVDVCFDLLLQNSWPALKD
jgi:hypothetical protein